LYRKDRNNCEKSKTTRVRAIDRERRERKKRRKNRRKERERE